MIVCVTVLTRLPIADAALVSVNDPLRILPKFAIGEPVIVSVMVSVIVLNSPIIVATENAPEIPCDMDLSKLASVATLPVAVMVSLAVRPSRALLRMLMVPVTVSLMTLGKLVNLPPVAACVRPNMIVLNNPISMTGVPLTVAVSLAVRTSDVSR